MRPPPYAAEMGVAKWAAFRATAPPMVQAGTNAQLFMPIGPGGRAIRNPAPAALSPTIG